MKQLLILIVVLFMACEKNDCESCTTDFSGQNYISINGSLIGISLTKSATYYPISLASDSYNLLDVNIDPAIKIVDEKSGEILTSYLATLPQSYLIGDVVANDPESGFYVTFAALYCYLCKTIKINDLYYKLHL